MIDDNEVIEILKSGVKQDINKVLGELYIHTFQKIKYYIINNDGLESDAEDIFQEGIVIFYQNIILDKFRGASKIDTYIFSICKNLWKQHLKMSKRKENQHLDILNNHLEDEIMDLYLLKDVLQELKQDCQNLLRKFYFENESIKEIRISLKITSDQLVKNKKKRCLSYLMKVIEKRRLSKQNFYHGSEQ